MTPMMVAAIVSNIEMNHKSVIFHPNRMKLVPKPMFLRSGSMIKQYRIVKNNLLSLYGIHDDDSLCFKQGNYTSVTYLSLLKIPNRGAQSPCFTSLSVPSQHNEQDVYMARDSHLFAD